ncbi:MAG: PepSY domain-containing protein [Pseudolabrys sp.]
MQNSSFKVAAAIFSGATLLKISALAVAVAILGLTSSAQAGSLGRPCTNASEDKWLTVEALQKKVEALGYTVRKGKLKKACGEFYVTDKAGNRVELFVDPTNGAVVGRL